MCIEKSQCIEDSVLAPFWAPPGGLGRHPLGVPGEAAAVRAQWVARCFCKRRDSEEADVVEVQGRADGFVSADCARLFPALCLVTSRW